MARPEGIDVSHWQGSINWPQVRSSGKEFAFIKRSEGTGFVDSRSAANIANARAAGVLVGVYHFARPTTNTAIAEAQHFLNTARGYVAPGYLPPVLDLEVGGVNTPAGKAFLSNWVNDWCTTVRTATGVDPIIYINTNYASNYVNASVNTHRLWIANWGVSGSQTGNPPTGVWPTWQFWQYSSTGRISGISTNVDLDVFKGTTAGLQTMVIKPAEVRVQAGTAAVSDGQAAAIDFGSVTQGQAGPSVSFTVYNDGGVNMSLGTPTVPAGYTVTNALAGTLAPGASDTFTVRLTTTTAATRSGQISFSTNDPDENPFNFPVTGRVNPADTAPPVVTAASFEHASPPHRITMAFSEDVQATLAQSDLTVENLGDGGGVTSPPALQYNAATRTATFSFGDYPGGQLPDGNYRATIPAGAVADAAGNPLAAFTLDFFVLAGDINRDRVVNGSDFALLAGNFGKSGMSYEQGDVNGDGSVNGSDFALLAGNFGKSLPPPAQPAVTVTPAAPAAGARVPGVTRRPPPSGQRTRAAAARKSSLPRRAGMWPASPVNTRS